MLRPRNSEGSAGFRRAQNTAPSTPLAPFGGREGTPPPVFAGRMRTDRKTVAGMIGDYAHVEIFNRAWQAFEAFLADCGEFIFLGRAWSGARPQSRTPGTTHTRELAPNGQKCFESLPSPVKDLHASRATGSFPQRSCTLQTNLLQKQAEECRLPAKKREDVPTERYFAPSGTSNYLPNFLTGASNAQHLMRISVPGTGTLPVGRVKGGRSASLIPTTI